MFGMWMDVRLWRLGSVVAVNKKCLSFIAFARSFLSHRNLLAASPPPLYRCRHLLLVRILLEVLTHIAHSILYIFLYANCSFCLIEKSEVVLVAPVYIVVPLLPFTLVSYICCSGFPVIGLFNEHISYCVPTNCPAGSYHLILASIPIFILPPLHPSTISA
jgi:hypothetical protein